jgi:hypothetical protein
VRELSPSVPFEAEERFIEDDEARVLAHHCAA